MKLKAWMKAKASIYLTAKRLGVPVRQCRRKMQQAIDAAWVTTDPDTQAYQKQLFPAGKPTVEEIIAVLGAGMKDQL